VVKWFPAILHYIALALLGIADPVCVVIAWFAILFTGRVLALLVGVCARAPMLILVHDPCVW
jgi:hypothetical protein